MARTEVKKVVLIGFTAVNGKVKVEAPTQETAIAALRGAGCVSYKVTSAVTLDDTAPDDNRMAPARPSKK